ncbi:MAG: hypothetical protein LBT27_01850 [Prevotellaceae bacterium]|jgi:hypothetical protein|nr:hypothetical protein [Prevotellaceae bacterium]
MQKTLLRIAKIIIFALIITSCSQKQGINSVNNRSSLRKEQRAREKNTRYWSRQDAKENKEEIKRKKQEEKEYNKYMKKERKRHLEWQDDDVKKRIKQNEKNAKKEMQNKAK